MLYVEPPPPEFASGPLHADLNVIETSAELVIRLCNTMDGLPEDGYYLACYVPETHTIIMRKGLGPEEHDQTLAHEQAHDRGWRHPARWPRSHYRTL